jgi:hypothetical protein
MMTEQKTFAESYDDLVLGLYLMMVAQNKKTEKRLEKKAKKALLQLRKTNEKEQSGFYIDELFEFACQDAEEMAAIINNRLEKLAKRDFNLLHSLP